MTEYPRRAEQEVVGTSPGVAARQGRFAGSEMRSPRAFLGSIAILLALPLAVLTQVVFGGGSGIAIHFALAVGSVLVGLSAFDFETPRWLAWMGCVSAIAFAAIFLLQNASACGERFVLPLHQRSAGIVGRDGVAHPPHDLARCGGTDRQPGHGEDPGFRGNGAGLVRGSVRRSQPTFSRHESVSGDPGREVGYLLPFVWLIFEIRKRTQAGLAGCQLPARGV